MDNTAITFLDRSEAITGYRVNILHKPDFQVTGYTLIVPPGQDNQLIPRFVDDLMADGRLDSLQKASSVPAWVLGLGSWDEACQPGGVRYTVCIEESQYTDLSRLKERYPLFSQRFEACDWMCFEIPPQRSDGDFWKDDPYRMLTALGYRFHLKVGVHFDVYPSEDYEKTHPGRQFWISVAQQDADCDVCSVRADCEKIQPFK